MDLAQEKELVARAKRDQQAFALLYDAYYGRIFGYALRRTADVAAAQDITAEVFFKALKSLPHFEWRDIPFSAWLYRIAGHEIANHYSRDWYGQKLTEKQKNDPDLADSPADEVEQAERRLTEQRDFLALHAALAQLPTKYQEVITLRYFEKKHLHEIGFILGKKEGTVKSLLHRGLEKLRDLLGENATFSRHVGSA